MKISKHWGISLLAVLSIGPGLRMNSAFTSAQRLVQQTFHAEANAALIPFVVGAVAFGLFVPFGPFLRHRIGALRTYVASMCLDMRSISEFVMDDNRPHAAGDRHGDGAHDDDSHAGPFIPNQHSKFCIVCPCRRIVWLCHFGNVFRGDLVRFRPLEMVMLCSRRMFIQRNCFEPHLSSKRTFG